MAEAVQLLGQARQLFEELQEAPEAATTAVVLAEVLFGAGRTEEARGVLDRMLADLGPDSLNGLEVRVHRLTGRLHASAGSLAEARSELIAGLELAEREADRYEQALLLRELVALAAPSRTEGSGEAERAAAILDAMGVVTSG